LVVKCFGIAGGHEKNAILALSLKEAEGLIGFWKMKIIYKKLAAGL